MTVTNVQKDLDGLTLTITTEFDATPERVWQLWSDPRELERWWGPLTYPATMDSHDLRPGGRVEYHMTGPTGDEPRGVWEVLEVDPPRSLVFRDLFAHANGELNLDLPAMTGTVTIEPTSSGRTQMSIVNSFET
ncbi:MAG: SRPBCC domain-containing protein, partial [Candidatus Limnocylindrales bacterium]